MKLIIEETDIKVDYDLESISPLGEMLLFDIETTGLKKETTQIYLIGCGYFNESGKFEVRQWMAESAMDEREVLESFVVFSKDYSVLIHFNGDGFDIPYTAYKAEYYGFDLDFTEFESIDIYKCLKPYKKFLGLERMNQTSVERFLKIERRDQMNGGILIPYFYEYERTGDPECERLLLLHNNDDVRGMIQLVCALSYPDIFSGKYRVRDTGNAFEVFGDTLIMEFVLDNPVPVPVLFESPLVMIAAEDDLLQINLRIYDGTARLPLPNVEDYYYLPAEERVIHKDVAEFVDRKYRKKATKKNCFLKKDGRFVPVFSDGAVTSAWECPDGRMGSTSGKTFYVPDAKGKLLPYVELDGMTDAGPDFAYTFSRIIFNNL